MRAIADAIFAALQTRSAFERDAMRVHLRGEAKSELAQYCSQPFACETSSICGSLGLSAMTSESPPPFQQGAFLTTRWTRVCLAKADSDDGRTALADLCNAYYEPIVAYLRGALRRGR